ncbi:porin family protein [Roseivirga sp. BDSF3-8]|uniref:porin family protein n=1 Tax=Roseivirga sp. BDSF3-8 TaxID=3241598 RepID=UPI00353197B5
MKKIFLVVAIAFMAVATANAQDASFGLRGGVNIASLNGDDAGDLDSKIGFHVGGFAQFALSDMVVLEPNVLFSLKGASAETEIFGTTVEESINLSYIDVPVLARIYVAEGFNVFVGPRLGLNLGGTYKAEADGESEEEDIEDLRTLTLGLNAGLGYELPSGLNITAGYDLGLSSIFEDVEGETADIKNGVIQVSVGYKFN